MAEKKKRSGRRGYLDDFHVSAAGEYVYDGEYYTYLNKGKTRTRAIAELWAFTLICAGASVAGGCISANGAGNCIYVLLPYVLEVAFAGSLVWGLIRLTMGGEPMRGYVYEATVPKLPRRAAACAIAAALGFLGEGVYLLIHGFGGKTAGSVAYLALKLVCAGLALLLRRFLRGMEWNKKTK